MRTEPEEAYEAVKYYEANNINIDAFRAKKLCDMAFYEGQSSPNIKQLEWEKGDGKYWEAITPIGTYSITFDFGVYVTLYDMDNVVDGEWRSLAKAKIACNNDFKRRVMECLE